MAKCVYRYDDINIVPTGEAVISLCKRAIIKETEYYVWHIHPPMGDDPEKWEPESHHINLVRHPWYKGQVIKTRKDAHRTAWHTTPEKALAAWRTRKEFQLKRLRLMLERVEMCVAAYDAGAPFNITPAEIMAGKGPVASGYLWGEY